MSIDFEIFYLSNLLDLYELALYGIPVEKIHLKIINQPIILYEGLKDPKVRLITCLVNAKEKAEKYLIYKEFLLMKNIRIGLKDSKVNEGIFKTSTGSDSRHFLYFNNGISIVADEFINSFNNLIIKNPQIVNGGQTLRVLAKALDKNELKDDVLVQLRIIEIQSVNLSSKITANLNSQNKIEDEDLFSSYPIVLLLKKSLEAHDIT